MWFFCTKLRATFICTFVTCIVRSSPHGHGWNWNKKCYLPQWNHIVPHPPKVLKFQINSVGTLSLLFLSCFLRSSKWLLDWPSDLGSRAASAMESLVKFFGPIQGKEGKMSEMISEVPVDYWRLEVTLYSPNSFVCFRCWYIHTYIYFVLFINSVEP